MARSFRLSLAPVAVAFAALFIALPQRGADLQVRVASTADTFAYQPDEIEAQPGDRIAFVNATKSTHTATCIGCPWDTGDIAPGQTVFLTFDDTASYRFFCRYHGATHDLLGVLIVGDAPPPAVPTQSPAPSP